MNAQDIAAKLHNIAKSSGPIDASIAGLRLDDPEGPLCQAFGADSTGRIRCSMCGLSGGEEAGCMRLILPIQAAIAKRNHSKAKIKVAALAEALDEHLGITLVPHQRPAESDRTAFSAGQGATDREGT